MIVLHACNASRRTIKILLTLFQTRHNIIALYSRSTKEVTMAAAKKKAPAKKPAKKVAKKTAKKK